VLKKRKEVAASVPARIKGPGWFCSHVVVQLQKSAGDVWPRISSATRPKKGGQGRVNGGLARSEGRRVTPSAGASSEGSVASRPHRPRRERTGTRPRVARERHPAVATSPKAVAWSRDRGCNDHRILRRVSCRQKASRVITRCFGHAKHPRVISAHHHHLRPAHQGQKPRTRRSCSPGEGRGGVRRGWGATGVSEARSHQRRGKKTPTLMTKAVRQ
jgi:hypothetical protein